MDISSSLSEPFVNELKGVGSLASSQGSIATISEEANSALATSTINTIAKDLEKLDVQSITRTFNKPALERLGKHHLIHNWLV